MAHVDKLIDKWIYNTPKDAPKDQVISVIKRFFQDQYEQKTGSHIIIQDDRLIGINDYGPNGDFSVAISGGQKVKGWYLKKLASTIRLLEEPE